MVLTNTRSKFHHSSWQRRSEAALKAKSGLVLLGHCDASLSYCKLHVCVTQDVPEQWIHRYKTFSHHTSLSHTACRRYVQCGNSVTYGSGLYIRACVSVSAWPEECLAVGTGIKKTRCEKCCPVLRNLDGCPTEEMYTGSCSTRRVGMITSGCPGSSPRTPEWLKAKEEQWESLPDEREWIHFYLSSALWPGLSPAWEAGNLLNDCTPVFHGYQKRLDVTWTNIKHS